MTVCPALLPPWRADDDVRLLGRDVDDLAFAFVAPLGADQDCVRHGMKWDKNCPDASGADTFGTDVRIESSDEAARNFPHSKPMADEKKRLSLA